MSANTDLIFDIKRKMLAKYPRFGSEIAGANIELREDLPCHTAATDGKNIYVDPNYFKSLNDDERLFTLAHEVMHIKFMHMYRLLDKEGNRRNLEIWNIATDAIINANLERDGFTIKEGYVNMPEALDYSAEEFYQKLLEEKQKKEQEEQQKQEKSQENSENSDEEKSGGDDHSLWEEAFEQQQQNSKNKAKSQQQANDKQSQEQKQEQETDQIADDESNISFDEKKEFEDNRQEKRERFKAKKEKTERDIRGTQEGTIDFGKIGESKEEIDWKVILRREVEKTETIWSQRRSIAENNYAYRLEENDIEDEAETEVMIDVSGSVQLDLVKAFLRQIKPILKQSKLKVGCFNEKFWGLEEIKNVRDIDNFTIPKEARGQSAWTEDWDLAVRSFTKKREINKIVFTDGYPGPGNMPKEDLKRENVIWVVYGNKDFNPCCGKVIQITQKQLAQLHLIEKNSLKDDRIR